MPEWIGPWMYVGSVNRESRNVTLRTSPTIAENRSPARPWNVSPASVKLASPPPRSNPIRASAPSAALIVRALPVPVNVP